MARRPKRGSRDAAGRLATERYEMLVREFGRELAEGYGWKSAAAQHLGVSPSYINKILAGEVQFVAPEIVQRAIDRLELDPRYFTDLELRTPHSRYNRRNALPEHPFVAVCHMWESLYGPAQAVTRATPATAAVASKALAASIISSELFNLAIEIIRTDDAEFAQADPKKRMLADRLANIVIGTNVFAIGWKRRRDLAEKEVDEMQNWAEPQTVPVPHKDD